MVTTKTVLGAAVAVVSVTTSLTAPATSRADDNPVMHHVKYTVSADHPIYADIYYLDQEPQQFSDYSHNPYQFVPNIHADLAPGKAWSYELDLARPEVWAVVTASTGTEPGTPQFHCNLTVDGKVVVSKDGPKGVLCSLRNW